MVLFLTRTYFPDGTNGVIQSEGQIICSTIELPWKRNEKRLSCIPEGEYFIRKRYSQKYQCHLEVMCVPGRDYILFHPANDALSQLQGCIAPVLKLSGSGRGLMSRKAFEQLKTKVFPALDAGESVQLIINS